MKPQAAQDMFVRHLEQRGLNLHSLRPAEGIQAMLDFYASERAEGCLDGDGDMLLYQWGTYRGRFDLDVTRHLIFGGGEDDDIWQLSLTFAFEASPTLEAVGNGNRWCNSPAGLDEFRDFVVTSPAYAAVGQSADARVSSDFGAVG